MLIAAAVALLAWGGHWLYQRSIHVYIDDARIDGEVVTVSSRVTGWITELPVIEGDEVKKGQLLVRVDERDSALQREVLVSKLQAIEGQMAVMRALIQSRRSVPVMVVSSDRQPAIQRSLSWRIFGARIDPVADWDGRH